MSWLPAFKIGIWNAWILMLFMALHTLIMLLIDKAMGTGNIYKKMGEVPTDSGEKRANTISTTLMYVLFAYSIFLPLKLGTLWFYAGILIYLLGISMFISAIITVAKTPMGQIFSQGMYRYSRHPLYLSFLIIYVGVSVASVSWVFLLLSIGWMVFPAMHVTFEERECLEAYGDEYQEYMNRTPKWIGIPKSS